MPCTDIRCGPTSPKQSSARHYLVAHPGPIDYQRRRELHYGGLLPPEVWAQICDRADLGPTEVNLSRQLARSWMLRNASVVNPRTCPGSPGGCARPHQQRGNLVERFTPEVIRTLDGEATRFLHGHNVFDEPVQWRLAADEHNQRLEASRARPGRGVDIGAAPRAGRRVRQHRRRRTAPRRADPVHSTVARTLPRRTICRSTLNPAATTPSAPHTSRSLPPASA